MGRFFKAVGVPLVLMLVIWGVIHVMLPPVHPDQLPAEQHAQSACWSCHFVLDSAEIVEVD